MRKRISFLWQIAAIMLMISLTTSCSFVSTLFEKSGISTFLTNWITNKIQVGIKVPRSAARGRALQSEPAEDLEFLNLVKLSTLSKEDRTATLEKIYSYMGTPYLPVGGGCQIGRIERDQNRLYFVLDYCAVGMLLYFVPSQGILTKTGGYIAETVGGVVTDLSVVSRVEDVKRPNLFSVVKVTGFGVQVELNDQYEIRNIDFRFQQSTSNIFSIMVGCRSETRALCHADQLTANTISWATDKLSPDMISNVKSWGTREMLTSLILIVFGPLIDDVVSLRVNHLVASEKALDITAVDLDVDAIDAELIAQLKAEHEQLKTVIINGADQRTPSGDIEEAVEKSLKNMKSLAGQIQSRGDRGVAEVKQKLLTLLHVFDTVPRDGAKKYIAYLNLVLTLDSFLSHLKPHEVPSTLREEIYAALDLYQDAIRAYLQPVVHSTLVPLKMVEATMAETEQSMRVTLQEGLYNLFRGLGQVIQPLSESTVFFADDVVVKRTPKGVVRSPNFTWTKEPEPALVLPASVDQLERSYRETESANLRVQILTRLAEQHQFQNGIFEDALLDVTAPAVNAMARQLLKVHGDRAESLLSYFLRKVRAASPWTERERYLLVLTLETLLDHPSLDLSLDVQAIFETFQGVDAFAQRILSLSLRYLIAKRGQVEALKLLTAKAKPHSLDECRVYRPLFYLMASDSGTDRVYWHFQALEVACLAMVP